MNIIAMIPARSGSKGLPDKNIRNLCGKPLIGYSIEAALGCDKIKEVFLNSDSRSYLDLGITLGAQPFVRSKLLAREDTPMSSVVLHFADTLKKSGKHFDAIIVLYPVYPLRTSADLTKMIEAFESTGGRRPLVGMKNPDTHPYLCLKLDKDGIPRPVSNPDLNFYYKRQRYPEYYELTHWACILPAESLATLNAQLMNENTYGYKIPDDITVVDIDTVSDFRYAEFLLQRGIHGA